MQVEPNSPPSKLARWSSHLVRFRLFPNRLLNVYSAFGSSVSALLVMVEVRGIEPRSLHIFTRPNYSHFLSLAGYSRQRQAEKMVISLGLEPRTYNLEGCCSFQLSYETNC